jgi:hypothetical protein
VRGKTATTKAHLSNREIRELLHVFAKTVLKEKQTAGATIIISIQINGAEVQLCLEPPVLYHSQAPTSQIAEQTSMAIESAGEETRLRMTLGIIFITHF